MRYVDEFRDPELIRRAAAGIGRLADPARHYRIMEVCGGHTHAIYRFGLEDLLPPNIELIHGPAARSASCRWDGSTTRSRWRPNTA